MGTTPFIGTEALASGALTRSQLRWNYDALHPDVYLAKGAWRHQWTRTEAAWLWTRRRGIVAGRAAVGQYAGTSVERAAPVELLALARRREPGVITRNERIAEDEIRSRGDMRVTTAERTALDLARHLPRRLAVAYLDVLAAATKISEDDVLQLAGRYPGARGIQRAREVIGLMDGGADSPEESRLRLLLMDAGLPRPETDIIVGAGFESVRIAMGWRRFKVGVMYKARSEAIGDTGAIMESAAAARRQLEGWMTFTVVPEHHRSQILRGVRLMLAARSRNRR